MLESTLESEDKMAETKSNRNTIIGVIVVIIVLAIIGYAAGWFGGAAPEQATAPAPAPATEQPAAPAPAPATEAPAAPAPATPPATTTQ